MIKKGFTLIELLVVIAIIGILATVLVANYNSTRQRARDAQRKSDLANIKTALQLYLNDFGHFPDSSAGQIQGCGTGGGSTCAWGTTFTATNVYMGILPNAPLSETGVVNEYTYVYTYDSAGDTYTLSGLLENLSDPDSRESQINCGIADAAIQIGRYMVCP